MIDPLTNKEKMRIDAFLCRNMEPSLMAADLIVGRNLLAFIQMAGQVETYLKEKQENERLHR